MGESISLTFLGTGHAHVTKCYNTCFVLNYNKHYFLTDAGGGNQILTNLEKINVPLEDINYFFISHSHTDHILGAIWVVRLHCASVANGNKTPLHIYGNEDVINKLKDICDALIQKHYKIYFGEYVIFNIVKDGDTLDFYGNTIRFFDVNCITTPQFGYTITFTNNTKLAFLGDEKYRLDDISLIKDYDWMIYDNTCIFYDEKLSEFHSSTKEGCTLAEEANIKNLILTHTEDIENRKQVVIEEGKKYYSGNLFCPDDFDVITIS